MIELLDTEFVNAWVLGKHLPSMAERAPTEELRALAKLLEEEYVYPVDSKVISPTLELLETRSAQGPGSERRYADFLRAGRSRMAGD